MANKSMRRMIGMTVSLAATLAAGPSVFAAAQKPSVVQKPSVSAPDTVVTNSGILANAQNPSDDIHQVSNKVDPCNHQDSAKYPNTTADFVIFLSGISNHDGDNFTAPITVFWKTQGNGSTNAFTSESGSITFTNKYAPHYQTIKIPVHYDPSIKGPVSFNLIITSVVNGSIGTSTAVEYIVNSAGSGGAPITDPFYGQKIGSGSMKNGCK
jgi:hypothetical protein